MASHDGFQVTVDLVVLTIRDRALQVLLVRRRYPPYRGRWALPGGFVLPSEDLSAAATRELAEETGIHTGHLEQLATYGAPRRDPRGRVVTVAYLALVPDLPSPAAGSDAAAADWVEVVAVTGLPSAGSRAGADGRSARGTLAFDHARILADGVERARAKLEYTPLGAAFCPPEFTVAQLRDVYEAVWGAPLDPRNFHRKVTATAGFVEPVGASTGGGRGRPAQLFRRGPAEVLYPPLLRPPAATPTDAHGS
jgi:8-oxo-dGTP diphosphatase